MRYRDVGSSEFSWIDLYVFIRWCQPHQRIYLRLFGRDFDELNFSSSMLAVSALLTGVINNQMVSQTQFARVNSSSRIPDPSLLHHPLESDEHKGGKAKSRAMSKDEFMKRYYGGKTNGR